MPDPLQTPFPLGGSSVNFLFTHALFLSATHTHTYTNTHTQNLQGLQVHTNTAVYTSIVTLGLHHNKHSW